MGKDVLFLSMKEDKSKLLAKVMSNETCRKIMDYLASKDATETEIATNLSLPLSTVHYNIDQMVKAGLIVIEEYHYSTKGKEVNHYKLANKYIFIYPGNDSNEGFNLKERFASFFPVLIAIVFVGFLLNMNLFGGIYSAAPASFDSKVAPYSSEIPISRNVAPEISSADAVSATSAKIAADNNDVSENTDLAAASNLGGSENVEAISVPWYDKISPSSKWFIIGGILSVLALLLLQYVYYLFKK